LTGFTDYMATRVLNNLTLKSTYVVPAGGPYLALFTGAGTDNGSGFTEVSGSGYARVAATGAAWNAASAGSPLPSTITNASTLAFNAATANWGTITSWGLYDIATLGSGNLLFWDYMGNFSWNPFSNVSGTTSTALLTSPGHGYANGDQVVVSAEYGGSLPAAFTPGTLFTVANLAGDSFSLGTAAATTGDGSVRKVLTQVINSGVTASFSSSTLTISLA
jgi:hypothetical protein